MRADENYFLQFVNTQKTYDQKNLVVRDFNLNVSKGVDMFAGWGGTNFFHSFDESVNLEGFEDVALTLAS